MLGMKLVSGSDRSNIDSKKAVINWALISSQIGRSPLLTYHGIEGDSLKTARLRRGTPVDAAVAVSVLSKLADSTFGGWVDDRMVYQGAAQMAWCIRGAVRRMHWRIGNKRLTLDVPWPNLVFVAGVGGRLTVHAYKGGQKPGPNTALFHAPLGNFYADGTMCWGSVERPAFSLRAREAFEAAVFDTSFSHVNHERTLSAKEPVENEQFLAFWRDLHQRKVQRFPEKRLAPTGVCLGDIIQ